MAQSVSGLLTDWKIRGSNPGWGGARFPAHFQTGPWAHTAYSTMGTGSFPGLKRPGRGVDHQPPSSAEVNEVVELYLYALCAFLVCYRVNFVCDKLNLLN